MYGAGSGLRRRGGLGDSPLFPALSCQPVSCPQVLLRGATQAERPGHRPRGSRGEPPRSPLPLCLAAPLPRPLSPVPNQPPPTCHVHPLSSPSGDGMTPGPSSASLTLLPCPSSQVSVLLQPGDRPKWGWLGGGGRGAWNEVWRVRTKEKSLKGRYGQRSLAPGGSVTCEHLPEPLRALAPEKRPSASTQCRLYDFKVIQRPRRSLQMKSL